MSRAYRITVKESETRELKGSDEICTDLELLEILPPEQMADILRGELAGRGFKELADGTMQRVDGDTTVTVDPCSGQVSVKSVVGEEVKIEVKREATGYDDVGPDQSTVRDRVKEQLKQDIDKKAEREVERLQGQATEKLEKKLDELQPELGQVINKVTRDALKEKAKQMGTIKEVAEDAETGNLTIKIEV
jgi:pyruvate formate-lyase activating enzyme-like uncharacterized protein